MRRKYFFISKGILLVILLITVRTGSSRILFFSDLSPIKSLSLTSNSSEFETDLPKVKLISPSGNISTNTPVYSWHSEQGASRYRLRIRGEEGILYTHWYSAKEITDDGICSVTSSKVLDDGKYSWKVKAKYGKRGKGPWSKKLIFEVVCGVKKIKLNEVKHWAYNIQDCNTRRQRDELVGTHFDMYVLEPVVTEKGEENFNIKALVRDIREYNIRTRKVDPLILAYFDVGQAEDWRWYFQKSWRIGNPEWIVGDDPDDWEGCYPVAYWYPAWQNIVIYGYNGKSMVEESLKAGFDGIYMDWIEAFSDLGVIKKARKDGVDTAKEMFKFIEKIRNYARFGSPNADPEYLVIAQNASDLYQENPQKYREIIDAIALEAIWYDGDGGFDNWNSPRGYNVRTNSLYPGWTQEVLTHLQPMKQHMPIFCVEYAQDLHGQNLAARVYESLAPGEGFIAYCTRRSLARLSKTPYPLGYTPKDY